MSLKKLVLKKQSCIVSIFVSVYSDPFWPSKLWCKVFCVAEDDDDFKDITRKVYVQTTFGFHFLNYWYCKIGILIYIYV